MRIDEEQFIPLNANKTIAIGKLVTKGQSKDINLKLDKKLLLQAIQMIDDWNIDVITLKVINAETPIQIGNEKVGVIVAPRVEDE